MALRCMQCGGSNFRTDDDALHAVCLQCGMESQHSLNTTFDDWEEERAMYERGTSRRTYKRSIRKARIKKSRGVVFPELPPEPDVATKLEALWEVAAECASALVSRCDVKIGDIVGTLKQTWLKLSTEVSDCDPSSLTKMKPQWKSSRNKKSPGELRSGPPSLNRNDELCDCVRMETVLGALYYACRVERAAVAAWDIERWVHVGLVPWLAGWSALRAETRAKFAGRAKLFQPRRVPSPSLIALLAEVRVARLIGKPAPVIDRVAARRLCEAFSVRLGMIDAPAVSAQASRLAELADICSETRALCCVLLACELYHDLDEWTLGETAEASAEGSVPWVLAEAPLLPRLRSEYAHYADFCSSIFAIEFNPSSAPAGAATIEFADELDKIARRSAALAGVSCRPLFRVGPATKLRSACRAVSGALEPGTLLNLAARYALCPPPILKQELNALLDRLDEVARRQPDCALLNEDLGQFAIRPSDKKIVVPESNTDAPAPCPSIPKARRTRNFRRLLVLNEDTDDDDVGRRPRRRARVGDIM